MKLQKAQPCIYCGKPTLLTNNYNKAVCESEWVCEDRTAPTPAEEVGEREVSTEF